MAVQSNEWMEDFSDFFIERRLRPQLMLVRDDERR
jgi:fructosamine-3-kinase